MFFYNKKVIVKRYSSKLGEYNRPEYELQDVGCYKCTYTEHENRTSQLQPQKSNYRDSTLYTDRDADIRLGDVLYIYDVNEYDAIVLSSEYIMVADRPYKKRTHLEVPLKVDEEV